MTVTISDLNDARQDGFVAAIGHVFEHSPWIAAEAWHARPFTGVDDLYQALIQVLEAAPESRQIALILAHPDLAGRAAVAGTLTADSTREQASAGLHQLTVDQFETFTRLNGAYKERFGFPFIICVRDHERSSILAAIERRLHHDRQQEVRTALEQICRIARLRLLDILDAAVSP